MSNAIIGTGILIKAGDGASPEVFVTVAEIVSLMPPGLSRNEIDVSTHNEGQEAKILGMLRKGQPTFTINWIPNDATHQQIRADILANTKRNWRLTYPPSGTPTHTFPARVQKFEVPDVTTDAPLQGTIALTIDGTIVEA
jgi:tail tube protein